MSLTIGGIEIGAGQPCRFVAELSNNANRDLARMFRLMDAAKAAGVDLLKAQCYSVEELLALRGNGPAPSPWGEQGLSMRDLYTRAMTPREWFAPMFEYAAEIGLPLFSSVFGLESLAVLESLHCPAYKIARLDNAHGGLADAVAATGKPLLVSEAREDESVCSAARTRFLYCPPGYPQERFAFAWKFHDEDSCGGHFLGFSFHGTDIMPCIVAAATGAKLIEAHMMLAEEPSELESNVSLTQHQFADMIANVRRVEEMLA